MMTQPISTVVLCLGHFSLQGSRYAVLSVLSALYLQYLYRGKKILLQMGTQGQALLLITTLCLYLSQSAGDAPTTPKYTKDNRDIIFPASLPTPVLLSHTACHPLSIQIQDSQAKLQYEPLGKVPRPPASGSHEHCQPQHRRAPLPIHPASTMAFHPQTGQFLSSLLLQYIS